MTQPTAIIHGTKREIMCPDLTDAQVASGVFMCSSGVDPSELISVHRVGTEKEKTDFAMQMAMTQIGRDRLLHLSQRNEILTEALQNLLGLFDNAVYRQKLSGDTMYEEAIKTARNAVNAPATRPSIEPDIMKRK